MTLQKGTCWGKVHQKAKASEMPAHFVLVNDGKEKREGRRFRPVKYHFSGRNMHLGIGKTDHSGPNSLSAIQPCQHGVGATVAGQRYLRQHSRLPMDYTDIRCNKRVPYAMLWNTKTHGEDEDVVYVWVHSLL